MKAFGDTVSAWTALQQEKMETAKLKLASHWAHSEWPRRIAQLEDSLRLQQQRLNMLGAQAAYV